MSSYFAYNADGSLTQKTDRDGRVTAYDYDNLQRLTAERWLDGSGTTIHSIGYQYDAANQMTQAKDTTVGSQYDYTYDLLGRVKQTTVANGGPTVVLAQQWDGGNRRASLAATLGTTADFRDAFTYDNLGRMKRLDQLGQTGGNTVAEKRIDFTYTPASQLETVTRYKDLDGGTLNEVLTSTYGYDNAGRLTGLSHAHGGTPLVSYQWSYDAGNRLTEYVNSVDGTADYTYDDTSQLTDATYTYQGSENYDYDANGNRTNTGYTTGTGNRLTSDGTYTYTYDAEGNRTSRTNIATDATTRYEWDYRNRLVRVTEHATSSPTSPSTRTIDYTYDVANRLIAKSVDADGDGTTQSSQVAARYVYDGTQVVLALSGTGTVTNRYVYGDAVDQLLVDEQVGNQVYWPACDHLGTVRDMVTSSGTDANHILYNAFGSKTSETNAAVDILFGFTGRLFDEDTGLQNNLNRCYDPAVGRWASQDPIGFAGADHSLYRYVANNPTNFTDPTGLAVVPWHPTPPPSWWPSWLFWPYDKNPATSFDPSDLVCPIGMATTPIKAARAARLAQLAAKIEKMHLLPQQFVKQFERVGLKIKDYIIPLNAGVHRLADYGGVHCGKFEESWNGMWKAFFDKHPNPTKERILEQLAKMREIFGI